MQLSKTRVLEDMNTHKIIGNDVKTAFKNLDCLLDITICVDLENYKSLNYNNELENYNIIAQKLKDLNIKDNKVLNILYKETASNIEKLEPDLVMKAYPKFIDTALIERKCNIYNELCYLETNTNLIKEYKQNFEVSSTSDSIKSEDSFELKWINHEKSLGSGISELTHSDSHELVIGDEHSTRRWREKDGKVAYGYKLVLEPTRVEFEAGLLIIDLNYYGEGIILDDIKIYSLFRKSEYGQEKWRDITDELDYYKDNKYTFFYKGDFAIAIKKNKVKE